MKLRLIVAVIFFLPVLIWPVSKLFTGNSNRINHEISTVTERFIEDLARYSAPLWEPTETKLPEPQAQPEPQPVTRVARPVNPEHLKCLAANIYWESAGEPFKGQVAVARVVMNRVRHGFGSNPCRVIYAQTQVPSPTDPQETVKLCQFSWVCEGKRTPPRNKNYLEAEHIAYEVLAYDSWRDDVPTNLLFFHNKTVNPRWRYSKYDVIGNHIFYTRGKPRYSTQNETFHRTANLN